MTTRSTNTPRRAAHLGALLALAACAGDPIPAPAPPPPPAGPSILWISLDTVRADHLALYGGQARCPTLEALAAEAVVFEHAFSNFPETQLSHWSMMTGVLPEVHGNVPAARGSAYTGPTAAELAAGAGYSTAAFIGGVTLLDRSCGLSRGFGLYDDGFEPDPHHQRRPAAELSAAARTWIDAQPGPWLAFVHYFDAHFPYTPADPTRYDPDYDGTYDGTDATLAPHRDFGAPLPPRDLAHVEALYDAEIAELDAALAPLLTGLPPDTVVVVTADHGESFDHGYLFNHRAVLWDGVLHVPLILRAPGLAPGRADGPVALIDLLPTVATAAGLPVPDPVQGRSLIATGPDHGLSLAPRADATLWARTDPWLPGALLAARDATHKTIWDAQGQGWRFDLAADPGELQPLPVPADDDGPARYRAGIEAMAPHQRLLPTTPPPLDPEEAARLQALGYLPRELPAPPDPASP